MGEDFGVLRRERARIRERAKGLVSEKRMVQWRAMVLEEKETAMEEDDKDDEITYGSG